MEKIECPQCGEQTISIKQKLKAGKWATIYCPDCGARMCSNPIVLALLYFVLTWNILFFGYLAVHESSINYAITMLAGWAIIEFFMFYIPLNRMRALKPDNNTGSGGSNSNG